MTPEDHQRKLQQYKFDCPQGTWEGRLDITYEISRDGAYCCFTCEAPQDYKGQKFRLMAEAKRNFRPNPTAPDMRDAEGKRFLIETYPSEQSLFSKWVNAEEL